MLSNANTAEEARGGWRALRSGRIVVVALAAAAILLIPAISAWALMSLRSQAISAAEIQTANLARIFAGHATRTVGEAVGAFGPRELERG